MMKRKPGYCQLIIKFICIAGFIFLVGCPFNFKAPIISTIAASQINYNSAISGGLVVDDGGSLITVYGVCFSTSPNPTIDNNTSGCVSHICGSVKYQFTRMLSELHENTKYYIRAYAKNGAGYGYGSQLSFTTQGLNTHINFNTNLTYGLLSDIEGNIYKSIRIGNQIWMAQNLSATKYNDGSDMERRTDNWNNTDTTGAFCDYNYDGLYGAAFGHLYNIYTITDSRNLCPTGWHVSTKGDWNILETYLGGNYAAGAKLKESGIIHWDYPNTDASNESGFSALPGGNMSSDNFFGVGINGLWWSRDDTITSSELYYSNGILSEGNGPYTVTSNSYYSVRCVKN